jgi:hypothetical protein
MSENYELRLSPEKSVELLVQLTSAQLSNPRLDARSDLEIFDAVTRAELAFNTIVFDVVHQLNYDPGSFKLPCD